MASKKSTTSGSAGSRKTRSTTGSSEGTSRSTSPRAAKKTSPTSPSTQRTPTKRSASKTTTATSDRASATTSAGTATKRKTTPKAVTKQTSPPAGRRSSGATAAEIAPTLIVREDESPWTAEELKQVKSEIEADVSRLQSEIQLAESDLVDLMRDSNDGAGDDQADAGAKTFEREQEITLANNARDMLLQGLHALERLENGTYGVCESCGNAIGKLRLQAAPRATLCMACKTKEERR